jgi:hypothetical protein
LKNEPSLYLIGRRPWRRCDTAVPAVHLEQDGVDLLDSRSLAAPLL